MRLSAWKLRHCSGLLVAGLLFLLLAGCGGGGGGGDAGVGGGGGDGGGDGSTSSATVTSAEGGSVAVASGANLLVPPGAVTTNTAIKLTESNDPGPSIPTPISQSVNSKTYFFEPDGLLMEKPAVLTVPFGTLPAEVTTADLDLQYFNGHEWVSLPGQSVDAAKGTISGMTDHFTPFKISSSGTGFSLRDGVMDGQICDGYLKLDFKVRGWVNGPGNLLDYLLLNPHISVAYKIELVDTDGWDETVRTIQVYSVLWGERYALELNHPLFNPNGERLEADDLLWDSDVYELDNIGAYSDSKWHVAHFIVVFDKNGNVVNNNGKGEKINLGAFDNYENARDNFLLSPTVSETVKRAIPVNLLNANHTFKVKVRVETINDGRPGDTVSDIDTKKFNLSDYSACTTLTLKSPTLTLTAPAKSTYNEGENIPFAVTAKDVDNTVPVYVTWSLVRQTAPVSVINEVGTTFSRALSPGSWKIEVSYISANGQKVIASKSIDVKQTSGSTQNQNNGAPAFVSSPSLSVSLGNQYVYQPQIMDPDSDPCLFTLITKPTGMTMNTVGKIVWTPTAAQVGNHPITLRTNDQRGHQVDQSYTLTVLAAPNNPPKINSILINSTIRVNEDVSVIANVTDADGDPLTYQWIANNSSRVDNPSIRNPIFRASAAGSYLLALVVSDGKALTASIKNLLVEDVLPADYDLDGYNDVSDCNDRSYWINPGRSEICGDGVDQDCSGADLVCPLDPNAVDNDGDGLSENNGDCNDASAAIRPGATDVCGDGIDQDCSGADLVCPLDPNDVDNDSDGLTENQGDCNDGSAAIRPGATEVCGDGVDQDCSGADLVCTSDPNDLDNDGDGLTENQGDCNDGSAAVHPGATEVCGDGIDQDCSGADLVCQGGGGTVKQPPLNDTGITAWGDATSNSLTSPPADFPGQDADFGRDAKARAGTLVKIGGGSAGFDFTKLDSNGNALSANATTWSCVRDNVTGLIWEVKTDDGGLRDKDNTYTWYNPDSTTNGGSAGTLNGGICSSGINCDTAGYLAAVNSAGLCGASDWRLPTRDELLTIVDNSKVLPAIDVNYFLDMGSSSYFWSSSPYAGSSDSALFVGFGNGSVNNLTKGYGKALRLVRGGQ